ncbi:hypothetical protein PAL_GLEAN10024775 [Pteropus alecto]|uniref:Uncharacterized protein n=1 Tax=Pteropus alecto TaxID=9402 RepID=L5JYA6_PTEAL|nr:hypothetical protein PAL_GLEAN10024775 [Pteropus alecto]
MGQYPGGSHQGQQFPCGTGPSGLTNAPPLPSFCTPPIPPSGRGLPRRDWLKPSCWAFWGNKAAPVPGEEEEGTPSPSLAALPKHRPRNPI